MWGENIENHSSLSHSSISTISPNMNIICCSLFIKGVIIRKASITTISITLLPLLRLMENCPFFSFSSTFLLITLCIVRGAAYSIWNLHKGKNNSYSTLFLQNDHWIKCNNCIRKRSENKMYVYIFYSNVWVYKILKAKIPRRLAGNWNLIQGNFEHY